MTENEAAMVRTAILFLEDDLTFSAMDALQKLLNPGGTMGSAFSEAQEISTQQAAERRRKGDAPYRKPKPTRAEACEYAVEDIGLCTSPEELKAFMWDDQMDDQLASWWESAHSLWLKVSEAYDRKMKEFERTGQCA